MCFFRKTEGVDFAVILHRWPRNSRCTRPTFLEWTLTDWRSKLVPPGPRICGMTIEHCLLIQRFPKTQGRAAHRWKFQAPPARTPHGMALYCAKPARVAREGFKSRPLFVTRPPAVTETAWTRGVREPSLIALALLNRAASRYVRAATGPPVPPLSLSRSIINNRNTLPRQRLWMILLDPCPFNVHHEPLIPCPNPTLF